MVPRVVILFNKVSIPVLNKMTKRGTLPAPSVVDGATRGHLIQQGQHPRFDVDREGTDAARALAFIIRDLVHRVKKLVVRMEGEERRILRLSRQADRG